MFTNKKRAGINTFVCAVSLYVAETPKASIKDHESPLPTVPFAIVAYGFVGQPFSKQLYDDTRINQLQRNRLLYVGESGWNVSPVVNPTGHWKGDFCLLRSQLKRHLIVFRAPYEQY